MSQSPPCSSVPLALLQSSHTSRCQSLASVLRGRGFTVCVVTSSSALELTLINRDVDIAILDAGSATKQTRRLLRRLRKVCTAGIVVISSANCTEDHVMILEDGADAYLVTPVPGDVLAATLRSVARRIPNASDDPDWLLEDDGWVLRTVRGVAVALTTNERLIMSLLYQCRGRAVERMSLIERLARDVREFDPHRLEVTIHRLRSKVFKASAETLPVRAVRNRGYIMHASRTVGAVVQEELQLCVHGPAR
jgi:DNA-binding response OmpR family regulator